MRARETVCGHTENTLMQLSPFDRGPRVSHYFRCWVVDRVNSERKRQREKLQNLTEKTHNIWASVPPTASSQCTSWRWCVRWNYSGRCIRSARSRCRTLRWRSAFRLQPQVVPRRSFLENSKKFLEKWNHLQPNHGHGTDGRLSPTSRY